MNTITTSNTQKVAGKKQNSLAGLTGIYMLGNLSSKVLSFLLVFFMTYFLSKAEIGQYDLILTSVSFIVPCVSLLLDSALLRWLLDPQQEVDRSTIFKNIYGLVLLNIAIYTIIFWLTTLFIEVPYSGYFYAYSVLMILFPTMQQGTRGLGKNQVYAKTSVFYSLLYVGFTGGVLYFFNLGVKGVLLANILALLIVIVWLFFENNLSSYLSSLQLNKVLLKDFCNYSLPLLPNTLSWWLIGSSTRFVILAYLGAEYNGLFAISYKYPSILLVITSVFTLAWQEKFIRLEESADLKTYFSSTLKQYLKLLFGLITILASCSKMMMSLIDASYFQAWQYIPVLLFAVMLQALSSFYGAVYLKVRKTKGIFFSSILGGLTTIGSSFLLVKLGLYGISISILLGYLVLLIYRVIQVRHFLGAAFPGGLFVQLGVLFALITATLYLGISWLSLLAPFMACGIFIYYNYSLIENSIKSKLISKWKKI